MTLRLKHTGYALATGSRAADRLQMLDAIFGPDSRELLTRVGLKRGCVIADIGCGTGQMALWAAGQVTETGTVWALDASQDQLRVAGENAKIAGWRNVVFRQASAYETGLPKKSFDFVYSRFLMCHLTRPAKALEEMLALVKVGGVLVCEDYEMSAVGSFPPTHAYARLAAISAKLDAKLGVDSDIGPQLPSLFAQAGIVRPEVMIRQPAFMRGEAKRFWALTLREAAQAIIDSGAGTAEGLDDLCMQLGNVADKETTLVLIARVFQVWGRKTVR